MSDATVIDAPGAQTALSAPLRAKSGEALLEAARYLASAREQAAHGEWRIFLDGTGTSEDGAQRLLNIHRQAEQDEVYRRAMAGNWLGVAAGAMLAAPSTPAEVRAEILAPVAAAAPDAPLPPAPSKREVEQKVQAAKPTRSNSAPVGDVPATPAAPVQQVTLTPATPQPATPLVLTPAQPVMLTPAPAAAGEVEVIAAVGPDLSRLRQAEALIALLEQAAALAYVERDQARHDLGANARFTLPDDAVEAAARTFITSPAVRSAASFLAMSAREE
jgi:hypothetical protein